MAKQCMVPYQYQYPAMVWYDMILTEDVLGFEGLSRPRHLATLGSVSSLFPDDCTIPPNIDMVG